MVFFVLSNLPGITSAPTCQNIGSQSIMTPSKINQTKKKSYQLFFKYCHENVRYRSQDVGEWFTSFKMALPEIDAYTTLRV